MGRQGILLPVPDGVRDLASLGGNAVVLSEDSPVSVRHLIQLLLRPVSVIPALLSFLLSHLLQSGPERRVKVVVGGEGRVKDGKLSACLISADICCCPMTQIFVFPFQSVRILILLGVYLRSGKR